MFHMEHLGILFSAAAATIAMAAENPIPPIPPPAPLPSPSKGIDSPTPVNFPPLLSIPLASSSEEACQQTSAGMLDLLWGWEESSRLHFEKALQADASCLLAYCGLLLTEDEPAVRQEALQEFRNQMDNHQGKLTPAESFYLAAFLKLLSGDKKGAADEFCKRADRYRADMFSACWGILLLHCLDYGYTPDKGNIETYQKQAMERAIALYASHPDEPLVCFVRAYIEEAAPAISPEAMEAARCIAARVPGHPAPQLLLGHLLYRSGQVCEAIPFFTQAAANAHRETIEPSHAALEMTARLYESIALWSDGQDKEALRTRRAMNAQTLDREHIKAPAVILQRWEAATLPLRVLVCRPDLPTLGEIKAASKAATVEPPLTDDAVLYVRDCLRSTLHARLKAAAGDTNGSLLSLQLAEQALQAFEATHENIYAQSTRLITPWLRAHEACQIALCTARAELYTSTAELWKQNARDAVQPVSLLLPPVMPVRTAKAMESRKVQPSPPPKASSPSRKQRKRKRTIPQRHHP